MAQGNDKGGQLVAAGLVGGGVTAIILKLLESNSAKAAAGDTIFSLDDATRQALAAILQSNADIDSKLDALQAINANLSDLLTALNIAPVAISPEIPQPVKLFDQQVRTATPPAIHTDKFADFRKYDRILIKAESSLNVAVNIQVIGNIFESFERTVDINGVFVLLPGSNLSVGLAWDDWHPFIGATITIPVAPTTGKLTIYSYATKLSQ